MTQSLPSRPSLEHLKNQAKALLRGARSGDHSALERIAAQLRRAEHSSWTLANAQFALAREYGFANWAELKQHVELAEIAAKSRAERAELLIRCCLDDLLARAERLLERFPDLSADNIYVAATVGDVGAFQALLQRTPELLNQPGGPLKAPPLVYACSTRFAAPTQVREPQVRAIVEDLLRRGADPNAFWRNPDFHNARLSALYGACGMNGNVALARLLLDAGAKTDDNESLYHSAEHADTACTKLLLERGAAIADTNAMHNAIGAGNTDALRLMLEHGGDVNERIDAQQGMTLLHWAIQCEQNAETLQLLIDQGADLHARSNDGLTPFRRAAHCGHHVALELLTRHGAAEPLSPEEEFVAACMAGDEPRARSILSTRPDLIQQHAAAAREFLYSSAWRSNLPAVRTLLKIGFDVAWGNRRGQTALHAAAWQGNLELVQFLLDYRPPLEVKETEYNCTPLEWAMHGSQFCRPSNPVLTSDARDERYAAIVTVLIAVGSPRPVDRLIRICTGAVEAALVSVGIEAEEDE